MVKFDNVEKSFGKLKVLNGVKLEMNPGRVVSVVGPNGSGKTTIIKCLLGMVIPDAGSISFNGKNIKGENEYRKNIGYMPQIGRYPENTTIGELIAMMKDIRKGAKQLDEEILHAFELNSMANKKMRTLSGGTIQKVSAALAFLFNPSLLVMDEPTSGLDPASAEVLKSKIQKSKNEGKLIVLTSHIMSEIDELADEMLYLNYGKIAFHKTIAELKKESGEERLGRAITTLLKQNQHA